MKTTGGESEESSHLGNDLAIEEVFLCHGEDALPPQAAQQASGQEYQGSCQVLKQKLNTTLYMKNGLMMSFRKREQQYMLSRKNKGSLVWFCRQGQMMTIRKR